jgi:hypothetical protein
MPDLTRPVEGVSKAVNNLVKVRRAFLFIEVYLD